MTAMASYRTGQVLLTVPVTCAVTDPAGRRQLAASSSMVLRRTLNRDAAADCTR
jgi:hypothetical protein